MKKYQMIQKILDKNGVFADAYPVDEEKVAVEIHWGDWKHEHMRTKFLLSGYEHLGTEITEEDGGDCYSAIHYFK